MRSQIKERLRSSSLKPLDAIPPPQTSTEYSKPLANLAARILYRSPLPLQSNIPTFVLDAAALPDVKDVDYDVLLPYVLARLPEEEELIGGSGYEVVFFAGGGDSGATASRKARPGWGWFLQAYHVLTRATRKRLRKLYLVHEKKWIRVLVETFSTVVSPKFRKKIVHVSTITGLALHIPIEDLLIPPSAYLCDRRRTPDIHAPYASGRRAFGVRDPLPLSSIGSVRLPRILRESTSFLLMDRCIKTEGIFRVNARAAVVDILKEAYDRGQKFIVWRERDTVLVFSHSKPSSGPAWVEDAEETDGYGVYTAASLIKCWYSCLRDPIFPESCYVTLERQYGTDDTPVTSDSVLELLSRDANFSIITQTAKLILIMHLLPLLSKTIQCQDWNHMSPFNLAVCFAPALLCGPDPIRDAKITCIVRRILEAAITDWKTKLAPALGMDDERFDESLRVPEVPADREDPLEEVQVASRYVDTQSTGIILVDNDESEGEEEYIKPALPPRPATNGMATTISGNHVKRKLAPTLPVPPRYSTVFGSRLDVSPKPPTYNNSSHNEGVDLSSLSEALDTDMSPTRPMPLPRKPVPTTGLEG